MINHIPVCTGAAFQLYTAKTIPKTYLHALKALLGIAFYGELSKQGFSFVEAHRYIS